MLQETLFSESTRPITTDQSDLFRLKDQMQKLVSRNIYFGTSSWKYPAWQGEIYHQHYASKSAFDKNCLREYAGVFSAVGGDFSFYNWPQKGMLQDICDQTDERFRIVLKCTDVITMYKFPLIARWKDKAGKPNENFLNAELFIDNFAKPVAEKIGQRFGPILLEFTAFPPEILRTNVSFWFALANSAPP